MAKLLELGLKVKLQVQLQGKKAQLNLRQGIDQEQENCVKFRST